MRCLFCDEPATTILSIDHENLHYLSVCVKCSALSTQGMIEMIERYKKKWSELQMLTYFMTKADGFYWEARGTSDVIYPNLDAVTWSTITAEIYLYRKIAPMAKWLAELREMFLLQNKKTPDDSLLIRAKHHNTMLKIVDEWAFGIWTVKAYHRAHIPETNARETSIFLP